MTPRWERIEAPLADPDGPLFMDAVLTPNRSLSRGVFRIMMAIVIFVNGAGALIFFAHGAYPVSGFLGLDVLALALAFHLNYRSGRARERVRVERAAVHVTREAPGRALLHWAVSPYWARVRPDPVAVRIDAGGSALKIGGFLSPPERAEFAEALKTALAKARG